MAIEIAADFRRLTRAGVWSLAGILTLCAAAVGQAPLVSVGSVVPIPINSTMNQIYRILFYKGNVLALDSGADVLYQLPPGATIWNNISGTPRNSNFLGGGYNASDMAIDAQGTIYISASTPPSDAGTALFWRFPYDPSQTRGIFRRPAPGAATSSTRTTHPPPSWVSRGRARWALCSKTAPRWTAAERCTLRPLRIRSSRSR